MKFMLLAIFALIASSAPLSAQVFVDDFNAGKLDASGWTVSKGKAPQGGIFDPANSIGLHSTTPNGNNNRTTMSCKAWCFCASKSRPPLRRKNAR